MCFQNYFCPNELIFLISKSNVKLHKNLKKPLKILKNLKKLQKDPACA